MNLPETQLQEWRGCSLPVEAIAKNLVLMKAQALSTGTGITLESGLLLAAMILGAAAGPVEFVANPLGYSLSVSFNLLVVGVSSALISSVIRSEFSGFKTLIAAEVRRAGLEDVRYRREKITQIRLELLAAENILSERVAPNISLGPLSSSDPEIRAMLEAHQKPFIMSEAENRRKQLSATLLGLMLASYPHIVADELTAEELCEPQNASFDMAVHNLSLTGRTLRSIGFCSPQQLARLGRMLDASWTGTAPYCTLASCLHRPIVSNGWILGREEARAFLAYPLFIDNGISSAFIAADGQAISTPDPSALGDPPGWGPCLDFYWLKRIAGKETTHRLTDEAGPPFLQFVSEVDELVLKLPLPNQPFALRLPDLALKIALLICLGSYSLQPPGDDKCGQQDAAPTAAKGAPPFNQTISKPMMRLALAVIKRVAAAQLSGLSAPDASVQGDRQSDREVERMWGKLKQHGPMTRNNLFRKYSKQRNDLLMPILLRGLAASRILQEGRLLTAADFPVSESVSGSAASSVSDDDFCASNHLDNPQSKNGV